MFALSQVASSGNNVRNEIGILVNDIKTLGDKQPDGTYKIVFGKLIALGKLYNSPDHSPDSTILSAKKWQL